MSDCPWVMELRRDGERLECVLKNVSSSMREYMAEKYIQPVTLVVEGQEFENIHPPVVPALPGAYSELPAGEERKIAETTIHKQDVFSISWENARLYRLPSGRYRAHCEWHCGYGIRVQRPSPPRRPGDPDPQGWTGNVRSNTLELNL